MTEKTTVGELMEELMVILDDNALRLGSGVYDEITRKLKEKYDTLERQDVLVKKPWKENNYKVKYMALAPRRREFRFIPKAWRKEYVSRIHYELKTQIFLGESLSKLFTHGGYHWKERIEKGEEFHEVINEKIEKTDAIEGRIDDNGNFDPNCCCCIQTVVCDSDCGIDEGDTDECECEKCTDIEVRATPMYILSLEKV